MPPTVKLPDDELRDAAAVIAESMTAHEAVVERLFGSLNARKPGLLRTEYETLLDAALDRFAAALRDVLEAVLPAVVEHDTESITAIRRFLLEPQETYSVEDLAALWRIPSEDIRDIYHDELAGWAEAHPAQPGCLRVTRADAVGTGLMFNLLRPFDVERALGDDFNRVRPDSWRTVPVLIWLPRFIADALPSDVHHSSSQHLAEHVERFILELFEGEHTRAFAAAQQQPGEKRTR